MMDYTDRHCRYLMRLLTPSALLYTEMVTDKALLHGDPERLLAFSAAEQPVALQLGGSEPADLARAANLGEQFGYREINLNCGCPSDRVKSGRFGACLMGEPERVRDCVAAMREAVALPVTVKCRIGIEPGMGTLGDLDYLGGFISKVMESGCDTFVIHARRAVLSGLSPKENREIPPLRYEVAAAIKQQWPHLQIILNGGLKWVDDCLQQLRCFDGVMIGREAYQNPWLLAQLHQALLPGAGLPERSDVVRQYAEYAAAQVSAGERGNQLIRHVLGLYHSLPGGRSWRRYLTEGVISGGDVRQLLLESLRIVERR